MKQAIKKAKKYLRTLREQPAKIKSLLHIKYPNIFGFETSKPMVQFYRNDSHFKTLVSFNHFIEVFTDYQDLEIDVQVQAYDRSGKVAGTAVFVLNRGAKQFHLHDLMSGLDEFGMFTLSFLLKPNFVAELSFLHKVSCQFMTVYVPTDKISAPQMIHSHKELQGTILLSRDLQRRSNSIETLKNLEGLEIYFMNPSASAVNTELVVFDIENSRTQIQKKFRTSPYSCVKIDVSPKDISTAEDIGFVFKYNKNINHKKPILFRKFQSKIWSCNHT